MIIENEMPEVKRKKVCPRCGRKLWLREFYRMKNGGVSCYCKECSRKRVVAYYTKNLKKAECVFVGENGTLLERRRKHPSIYWSGNMISMMVRHFPNTKNEEMAEMLGVGITTVKHKAKELGLRKSKEFMQRIYRENGYLALSAMRKMKNYQL